MSEPTESRRVVAESRPLPSLEETPYAREFWDAATEGRLVVQRCETCARMQYFPRPRCGTCGGSVEWIEASGLGTVFSHTVIRRPVSNPAFRETVPYVTAYVTLEEGPRLFTRLVGCEPDTVERGMPVSVAFEQVSETVTLPTFEPR
ncbi:Zn-ribbon domain-containing OB-fold protein [Halovivax cerinus]|uniref:Zn-ribbon domain-containing OB-fold protein n=1 Tax=Halovivax cerinus TaxID=1487865 RepID=A0ABD5NIQ3_9EURY|nr:Zn-ribbon domain-containing OB-fold protein [Halovivax cerinus]